MGIPSLASLVKNYRTYTLYDFSTTLKVKIFVFEAKDVSSFAPICKKTLPAQINPDNFDWHTYKKSANSFIATRDNENQGKPEEEDKSTIHMEFQFNLVDEYEARTMGGKLPIDFNIDDMTILGDLRDCACSKYICVLKWGPLEEVVRIARVECKYDSYSPYGEALSASANVTFETTNLDKSTTDRLKLAVKTRANVDLALVVADYAATYAASEFIPSIVSSARNQEGNDS